ncbi:MAG TPA: HEAT repeat domain-containing protein [Ignavibacteria bacterium]|nr:HEAT repeat domain-containing protein [Ignavibacteria bacterium]
MPDTLLTNKQKKEITRLILRKNYRDIISILKKSSTAHAGSAKTKDKSFVILKIIKSINEYTKGKSDAIRAKEFFNAAKKFYSFNDINAIEIGVSLIWRGYEYNKGEVTKILLKTADHDSWEVREWAAGVLGNLLHKHPEFYDILKKWIKHKSPNVRRAVVLASVGLTDPEKPGNVFKAFQLLEPLLYDSAVYVKKNLGPFVLGGWWGRHYPKEFFKQLDKWIKIKDCNLRWNIAMCFNNSTGNKYPIEALKYLKILNKDKNPVVQSAVKSTSRFLSKRNELIVNSFIELNGIVI